MKWLYGVTVYGSAAILGLVWFANFLLQNQLLPQGLPLPGGLQPTSLLGLTLSVLIAYFAVFGYQLQQNLNASRQPPRAQLYTDQAKTYEAAAELVRNPGVVDQDHRDLWVVSYASRRGDDAASNSPRAMDAVNAFDAAINTRIEEGWNVRRLWVVSTEGELGNVEKNFVRKFPTRTLRYDVSVLVYPKTLPPLQVLVCGNDNVFLGLDSQLAPGRTENGLHLKGETFVRVAKQQFESLWQLSEAHHVRTQSDGINETALQAARSALVAQPIVTASTSDINQQALDLVARAPRGSEFRSTSLWFYANARAQHATLDHYYDDLAERLNADLLARYRRAVAVDSRATWDIVKHDVASSLGVRQISTRVYKGNPIMMDFLISETEAILAWPQSVTEPNAKMAIVLREPDSVRALRRWYDEFIWDHSIIPNVEITPASDLNQLLINW